MSEEEKTVDALLEGINGTDETENGVNVVTNVKCLKEICVGG